MSRRITALLIVSVLFAYFWIGCGQGVHAYFHEDDLMNLYRAIDELPGIKLLTANLTPFTPANRPTGALYYRGVHAIGGFDPLPFRVVTYCFLVLNAVLLYLLARRLSGKREVGVVAVLVGCYHHRFVDIYVNNGTVYDVLCATFYLLAVIGYVRWRSLLLTVPLFILSINAKEMAASLPIILFLYELIFHPPAANWRERTRWLFWQNRTAWVCGLITIFAARAKTAAASAFSGNQAYQIHISWHNFVSAAGHWFDEMFYTKEAFFGPALVVAVWLSMLAIAVVSRRRYLLFAFCWLLLTPLPVSFIPQRGFFVMYLPWVGLSLYAAGLLVEGRDFLYRRVWKRAPILDGAWQPERLMLFTATFAVLAVANAQDPYYSLEPIIAEPRPMRDIYRQLQDMHRSLPRDSKILMLNDPMPADTYMFMFLVRVSYGWDVDFVRAKQHAGQRSLDPREYNYVWDYRDNHFVEVKAGPIEKKT